MLGGFLLVTLYRMTTDKGLLVPGQLTSDCLGSSLKFGLVKLVFTFIPSCTMHGEAFIWVQPCSYTSRYGALNQLEQKQTLTILRKLLPFAGKTVISIIGL